MGAGRRSDLRRDTTCARPYATEQVFAGQGPERPARRDYRVDAAADNARDPVCAQAVIATASLNASDGERQPRVCRGRPFRDRAMALSSETVTFERSVVFGKY